MEFPHHLLSWTISLFKAQEEAGFFSRSHLIVLPSLTPQADISIFTDLDRSINSSASSHNLLMSPLCLQTPVLPSHAQAFSFSQKWSSTQAPGMGSRVARFFPHGDPQGYPLFQQLYVFCMSHFSALPPNPLAGTEPSESYVSHYISFFTSQSVSLAFKAVTVPYITNIPLTKH